MISDNKLVMIIIALFLPPLAVFLQEGLGKQFVINIILILFFFLPSSIHALWLIATSEERDQYR